MGNCLESGNKSSSTPPPSSPSTSTSSLSSPTPSTSTSPLSSPAPSTTKTDLQLNLIQVINDVSTAAYCPNPDMMCAALKIVDTLGPEDALSALWELYLRVPSELQISLFHIFLSLNVKHPGTALFDEQLFLPDNGLLYFHRNREWILLSHLLVGIHGYFDSPFYQMAYFEETFTLTLVEILQEYTLNIPEWVDLLIEKILLNGASCKYLCTYSNVPALHVAAEIATVSGQFKTFSYVLQWASTSKDQLDATDRNKQTAFEKICGLVDDHSSNSQKVLTQLLDSNCRLPHSTSESCHKIPADCVDEELFRLKQILKCSAETMEYGSAAIHCRRAVDLLLCCHRVEEVGKYHEGLYDIHLDKMEDICVSNKQTKLRSAHYTFTFLNYLENNFCLEKVKKFDKDIDAILKKIYEKEKYEVNKFLVELSKSSASWPMLYFLLSGTKLRLKSFNASHMNISTLLESRKSNEISRSSALELLMKLLNNGLLSGHDSSVKLHKILQLTLDIGCLDALDYCLNNKNINVVNARNETLLHSLVQTEVEDVRFYVKVMQLLVKKGINKSLKDSQGRKAEDLVSISDLRRALLKVDNINCCDNLKNVMTRIKKLKSTGNKQLLASYCIVGMHMMPKTDATLLKLSRFVELCSAAGSVTETAVSILDLGISRCSSVQDVLLISDDFYGMGNYKVALEYCGKACKFIPPKSMSSENDIKPILYEIIKITVDGLHMTSFPDYKTQPDIYDECKGLESFILQSLPLLFTIGNQAIERGENLPGAFAFNTVYTYWPYHAKAIVKIVDLGQLHTSAFKMDVMQKLIALFVKHNLDLRKLVFHDGDTYLHSCVRLSLYYGYFDLLELIINCRTVEEKELHIIDNNERTAFDLLRFCRNGEFHEQTQNILLQALIQVPSKKKILMTFPNPIYLYAGDGVVVKEGGV